jgi:hypothetical protein
MEEKKIRKMENKRNDIHHHHACSPFFGTQPMQKSIQAKGEKERAYSHESKEMVVLRPNGKTFKKI